jgi:hypothetical protein
MVRTPAQMHYGDDVNLRGQNSVDDSERKALAQPLPRSPARPHSRIRICWNASEKTLNFGAELQPNLFGLRGVEFYRLLKFPFGESRRTISLICEAKLART